MFKNIDIESFYYDKKKTRQDQRRAILIYIYTGAFWIAIYFLLFIWPFAKQDLKIGLLGIWALSSFLPILMGLVLLILSPFFTIKENDFKKPAVELLPDRICFKRSGYGIKTWILYTSISKVIQKKRAIVINLNDFWSSILENNRIDTRILKDSQALFDSLMRRVEEAKKT